MGMLSRNVCLISIVALLLLTSAGFSESQGLDGVLQWSAIPALPDNIGVAGPFSGVHLNPQNPDDEVLIVAGGANFAEPDNPELWDLPKRYHADAWLLKRQKDSDGNCQYKWLSGFSIDKPMAYGASISTEYGVVCIGGEDGKQAYSDVFLLSWEAGTKTLKQTSLPNLPQPLHGCAAAMVDNVIYVAGGMRETGSQSLQSATNDFWTLDMSKYNGTDSDEWGWTKVLSWPGPARAMAIAVSQHNGFNQCVYVLSGRRALATGEENPDAIALSEELSLLPLRDVYEFCPAKYDAAAYDPETGSYTGTRDKTHPWRKRADAPFSFMAGTAAAVGQSHIFTLGGASGSILREVLVDRKMPMKDYDHPGFPKTSLAYHTITDTWIEAGDMPSNQVTTQAVQWGGDTMVISGEVRPRVRTSNAWAIQPAKGDTAFGAVNFSVLGIYLLLVIGVGVFFSFRNKNSDDFFRGGQRVPWFVAGLSIFATMLSSITFIAIPAKAYMTDWVYFAVNMTAVLLAPFVIWLFLPFFRKIDATSAYEYLEKRFNLFVRLFASASFIVFQVGRMAVVMYLPALALAAITPLTEIQCILLMGVLSIIYCTMGGLEAVVWTDTIQSFVLLGGALLSLLLIIFHDGGSFGDFVSTAAADSKFHIVNWDFSSMSFATTALWVVVLGGIGQSLVPYSSDMAVVQRYMSVPSLQQARKAIWTNAIAVIPASILFFGVGTALFVFYKNNPGRLDPTFKNDAIFPLFIARELPIGFAGLVVAGVFAAAQSTISTSMNSTSTAFVTDFVRPFNLVKTERGYLNLARVMTFTLGCLGTALAVLFASSDIKSLWDVFMKILGLLGGSMCGLFCLGIFTTRTNGKGAIIGAMCGAIGLYCVQQYTQVHLLLYATVGIVFCIVTGYAASLFFPRETDTGSIEGLTIHTLKQKEQ